VRDCDSFPVTAFDPFEIPDRDEVTEALAEAFNRMDDFLAVQSGTGEISLDAVECLQAAVGIEGDARQLFKGRLAQVSKSAHAGQALLGVIVGLLAAEAGQIDLPGSNH
jgi:hypothetical protein